MPYIVQVRIGTSPKVYFYLSPIAIMSGTKVLINLAGRDTVVRVLDCDLAENIVPDLNSTPYELKYISGIIAQPEQIIPSAGEQPPDISLDDILLKLGFTRHDNETAYFDPDEDNTMPALCYFSKTLNQGFSFKSIDKIAPTLANYYYRMGYRDCMNEIS